MLKSSIILLLSFLIVFSSIAQKNPVKINGTVLIDNSTSMKTTEVTIKEWIEFIVNNNFDASLFPDKQVVSNSTNALFNDLQKGKDFEYITILNYPRISKEIRTVRNFKKLVEADTFAFSLNLPITGISFQQARRFCAWKENSVNASQAIKIKVSLPSIETLTKVITNKDSVCKKKCDSCEEYQLNCISSKCLALGKSKLYMSAGLYLVRVDAYWPSDLGLYNLQGNAAEMTSTEGIAIGGSFRHYAIQSFNDQKQQYNKAENWLGFRYTVTLR